MGQVKFVSAKDEWARGWKVPVVSALAYALSHTHLFSLGVLMPGIEEDMGWSRSQISAGLTFIYSLLVVVSPFLGGFIDRFGSRPIALLGILFYCVSLASFSIVGESIWYWWGMWLTLGLGHVMLATPVWASAVVSLFTKARGLAIAATLCGAGFSSAMMPIIAESLRSSVGWRGTYLAVALVGGVVTFILLWLFFHSAQEKKVKVKKRSVPADESSPATESSDLPPLRSVLLSSHFLRMAVAGFLITLMVMSFMVHFVPILIDDGIKATTAASIASAIGFSAMAGRLVVGAILDRVQASYVGLVVFALPALICAILLINPGVGLALVCAILIGFTVGAEYDVLAYAISRYFDLRLYGTLFGVVFAACSLGSATGPLSGGLIYDYFGDYRYMFMIILPVSIFNALLIGSLGPYPDQHKEVEL